MKMKKHLILSMLLLGFASMLEAENVQRTLPDVVEGVRDEVISLNGEWQFQYAPGEKWERVTVPGNWPCRDMALNMINRFCIRRRFLCRLTIGASR